MMRRTVYSSGFAAIVLLMVTLNGLNGPAQETSTALPGAPGIPPSPETAVGPESSIEELISVLKTSTGDTRLHALKLLQKRGHEAFSAIPTLIDLVNADRIRAGQVVPVIGAVCVGADPERPEIQTAIDWLMARVRDGAMQRTRADSEAVVLGRIGPLAKRAAPVLYDYVTVYSERGDITAAVPSYNSDSVIMTPLKVAPPDPERIVQMLNDPHPNVRRNAMYLLDAARYLLNPPFTSGYAPDLPDLERCLAVTPECRHGDADDFQHVELTRAQLLEALDDPLSYIRTCAVKLLDGSNRSGDDLTFALKALRDDNDEVRQQAAQQLAFMPISDTGALESLRQALKDPSSPVAAMAAVALAAHWPSDENQLAAIESISRCTCSEPIVCHPQQVFYKTVFLGPKAIDRLVAEVSKIDENSPVMGTSLKWIHPGPRAVDFAATPSIIKAINTFTTNRRMLFAKALIAVGTPAVPVVEKLAREGDGELQHAIGIGIVSWNQNYGKSPAMRSMANAYLMELNGRDLPKEIRYEVLTSLSETGGDLPEVKRVLKDSLLEFDAELGNVLILRLNRPNRAGDYGTLTREVFQHWIKVDDRQRRFLAAVNLLDDPNVGHEAIGLLLEDLKTGDEKKQGSILTAIAARGVCSATEEVMAVMLDLFQTNDISKQYWCTYVWSKLGPSAAGALPLLRQALTTADPELVPSVARALLSIDPNWEEPAQVLQKCFFEGQGMVHYNAGTALIGLAESGWLLKPDHYQVYLPFLVDKSRGGDTLALRILSLLTPEKEECLKVLTELVRHPDWIIRDNARKTLAAMQDAEQL